MQHFPLLFVEYVPRPTSALLCRFMSLNARVPKMARASDPPVARSREAFYFSLSTSWRRMVWGGQVRLEAHKSPLVLVCGMLCGPVVGGSVVRLPPESREEVRGMRPGESSVSRGYARRR